MAGIVMKDVRERLSSLLGRGMVVFYIDAILVFLRPNMSPAAYWFIGVISGIVILYRIIKDINSVIRLVHEVRCLIRGGKPDGDDAGRPAKTDGD